MRRFLPTTLLVALSVGCRPVPVSVVEGPREYIADDYDQVLQVWTREKQVLSVSELDSVLTVTATYLSWDFRWAYVVRYAEDYRLTIEQRKDLLEKSLAETRSSHSFYVAIYAQRFQWQDLTADNPAWTVRLIDDQGNETAPAAIEAVRSPGVIERTYFPYTNVWRSVYRISFPRLKTNGRESIAPNSSWFGLRFAGAQGNEELVWHVERD